MKAGRHLNGTEIIFHSLDTGKGGFVEIDTAWDFEYVGGKLGKTLRICVIDITCPASPQCGQTGTVSYIVGPSKFMFQLMTCPVTATGSTAGKTVVRETSCPHDFCSGGIIIRLFQQDTGIVDYRLHQGFADAVCNFHSFDIYEIPFHGMHQDIHTAAFGLVLR